MELSKAAEGKSRERFVKEKIRFIPVDRKLSREDDPGEIAVLWFVDPKWGVSAVFFQCDLNFHRGVPNL